MKPTPNSGKVVARKLVAPGAKICTAPKGARWPALVAQSLSLRGQGQQRDDDYRICHGSDITKARQLRALLRHTGRNAIGVGQANDGTTFTFLMGAAMQQIQSQW